MAVLYSNKNSNNQSIQKRGVYTFRSGLGRKIVRVNPMVGYQSASKASLKLVVRFCKGRDEEEEAEDSEEKYILIQSGTRWHEKAKSISGSVRKKRSCPGSTSTDQAEARTCQKLRDVA